MANKGADLMLDTIQHPTAARSCRAGRRRPPPPCYAAGFLPMREMREIQTGRRQGIEGDRYMIGRERAFIRTSPKRTAGDAVRVRKRWWR